MGIIMSQRSRAVDSESARPLTGSSHSRDPDAGDDDDDLRNSGHRALSQAGQIYWLSPRKARGLKPKLLLGALLIAAVVAVMQFSPSITAFVFGRPPSGRLDKARFELLHVPKYTEDEGGERRLRLFMPADKPSLDLCKTIMSAVALGYPPPTILNWHGEFNRPEWHFAGSHIAKLESLLSVIETLLQDYPDDADEEDLALLVDAYDIWFQLPPSVLIKRFHQLNREADQRNRRIWEDLAGPNNNGGGDTDGGFPIPPPRQKIIVTTAKECFPDWASGSDPHYDHWPESPLPRDFYGDATDTVPWFTDPARKWRNVRPRCVNSGLVMGTMGALRDALRRARDKVDETARRGRQLWSDQALIAEVIGDQELWREWVRGLASTWNGAGAENDMAALKPEVRAVAEAAVLAGGGGRGGGGDDDVGRFEFGIGLDYNFSTIPPTCSAEEDGSIVVLGDRAAVERESRKAGVPGDGVRVASGVPAELEGHDGPVPGKKWDEVPLYTDYYFGLSPVGIHHNAYVDGLKDWRREHWWNATWFYPHLRDLVTENLETADDDGGGKEEGRQRPLATIPPRGKDGTDGTDGNEMVYYAPKLESGKRRTVTVFEPAETFAEIGWDGVCQRGPAPWHEKLFADGKGPLEA